MAAMTAMISPVIVSAESVRQAVGRIAPHAHRTPVLRASGIDALAHATLAFKCENFQRAGAFKFRGACNSVWALSDAVAARGEIGRASCRERV